MLCVVARAPSGPLNKTPTPKGRYRSQFFRDVAARNKENGAKLARLARELSTKPKPLPKPKPKPKPKWMEDDWVEENWADDWVEDVAEPPHISPPPAPVAAPAPAPDPIAPTEDTP